MLSLVFHHHNLSVNTWALLSKVIRFHIESSSILFLKMSKFRRLTKEENFKFIEIVQAYPPLYDGKLTEYKDKGLITKQSLI